jgi:hypothetical protein
MDQKGRVFFFHGDSGSLHFRVIELQQANDKYGIAEYLRIVTEKFQMCQI